MNHDQALAYVEAAAMALAVPMPAERAQRVATHLTRTAALAQLLEDFPLEPEDELAEIFRPKAVPPLSP